MPRHPADEILEDFLHDRDREEHHERAQEVRRARAALRRTIDSQPPPSELSASRQRVIERVGTDTGSHDLFTLEKEVRAIVERAAAEKLVDERRAATEKLNEEREKLRKAEAKLEQQGRFWMTILGSVIAGCVLGAIVWTTAILLAAAHPH